MTGTSMPARMSGPKASNELGRWACPSMPAAATLAPAPSWNRISGMRYSFASSAMKTLLNRSCLMESAAPPPTVKSCPPTATGRPSTLTSPPT